jgi:hypothetical protein
MSDFRSRFTCFITAFQTILTSPLCRVISHPKSRLHPFRICANVCLSSSPHPRHRPACSFWNYRCKFTGISKQSARPTTTKRKNASDRLV